MISGFTSIVLIITVAAIMMSIVFKTLSDIGEKEVYENMNKKGQEVGFGWLIALATIIFIIVLVAMWGMPKYGVYSKELSGKAQLREAEWNRQITIQEAEAEKASAVLKAEAEVLRARGIAEANEIIANSLTNEYIKYKFVEGLNDGNTEVIYVPTEANLPILEARG